MVNSSQFITLSPAAVPTTWQRCRWERSCTKGRSEARPRPGTGGGRLSGPWKKLAENLDAKWAWQNVPTDQGAKFPCFFCVKK